jgi:hypothetical protein
VPVVKSCVTDVLQQVAPVPPETRSVRLTVAAWTLTVTSSGPRLSNGHGGMTTSDGTPRPRKEGDWMYIGGGAIALILIILLLIWLL